MIKTLAVAVSLYVVLAGISINHLFAQSRLVAVERGVDDFVTVAQEKQNTINGCYVVVENLMTENMHYKKALGI